MGARQPVVRKRDAVTQPELHDRLMAGWGRCIARHGKGSWADALGISVVGLDKQLTGSMPGFDTIIDAMCFDDHVLDDVMAAIGLRLVSIEHNCDVEDLSLMLAKALVLIKEATHTTSPGGPAVVHSEYLAGEELMRQIHKASGEWLEMCAQIRRPRAVS